MNITQDRLVKVFDELKYQKKVSSQRDFGDILGYNKSHISELFNGKRPITESFVNNLIIKFGISEQWLKTGEGDIFPTGAPDNPEESTEIDGGWYDPSAELGAPLTKGDQIRRDKAIKPTIKRKIPHLGDVAASTDIEIDDTPVTYAEKYVDVGDLLRDSEAAFTVFGNSMTPAYPSGAQLGLKRNYDSFIQPGETYVIVTKSNRVFKRLFPDDSDPDVYICYSDNTMMHETGPRKGQYAYPPFKIHKRDIISIYDVVGMIKRNRNSAIYLRPDK